MNRIREFALERHQQPEITATLHLLRREMGLLASTNSTLSKAWAAYGLKTKRYRPLSLMPILDERLISAGIAAGWHAPPPRITVPDALRRHGNRFLMGELIYGAKQYQSRSRATDTQFQHLAELAACALAPTRFVRHLDLIVGVPSSRGVNTLPNRVVTFLAAEGGIDPAPRFSLWFRKAVVQSKQAPDYWSKRAHMHEAMHADAATFGGRTVLIVDDICDCGVTLSEAARACREAGAADVHVLSLSKTFSHQTLPTERPIPRTVRLPPTAYHEPMPPFPDFADASCGFPEDMTEVPIP